MLKADIFTSLLPHLNTNQKPMNPNKKYFKSISLIAGIGILLAGLFFYNQSLITAYYSNAKLNPFNAGDKVYANKYLISDVSTLKIPLMRLIKSNTSSNYTWIYSGKSIIDDSLEKQKSSLIGHYLKVNILTLEIKNKKSVARIYAIEPNWKTVDPNNAAPDALPANYSFADDNYYINWPLVSDKEIVFNK
jgi:hypothetical protein